MFYGFSLWTLIFMEVLVSCREHVRNVEVSLWYTIEHQSKNYRYRYRLFIRKQREPDI